MLNTFGQFGIYCKLCPTQASLNLHFVTLLITGSRQALARQAIQHGRPVILCSGIILFLMKGQFDKVIKKALITVKNNGIPAPSRWEILFFTVTNCCQDSISQKHHFISFIPSATFPLNNRTKSAHTFRKRLTLRGIDHISRSSLRLLPG